MQIQFSHPNEINELNDNHGHTHMSMRSSPRRDSPLLSKSQMENTSQLNDEVILIEDFDPALDSEFLN